MILKLHGSLSLLAKMVDIYGTKVRNITLRFEADFDSLNMGRMVTVCVYIV